MVRWVVGSILHGEPIELFLVPVTLVLYSLSHFKPELYNVVTSVLQSHLGWRSVCSWCDGSSDRSFMVNPSSYFSFQ